MTAPKRSAREAGLDGVERRATKAPRRRASAPRRAAHSGSALLEPGVAERRGLLLVTFLLLLFGLVMAYSASSAQAFFQYHSSFYLVQRQLVWAGLGVVAMLVLSRVDYVWWRRLAFPLAGVALLSLLVVLVPGVGAVINGARRWILLGGQTLQPSEFAKVAAVMLIATLIVRRPGRVDSAGRLSAARRRRHRAGRRADHAGAGPRHHPGALRRGHRSARGGGHAHPLSGRSRSGRRPVASPA